MPHEIKVGDVYQTGNGLTVRIIATDRLGTNYPVIGLIKGTDGRENMLSFTREGHSAGTNETIFNTDLILPECYEDWEIDDPIWVWNDSRMAFPRHFAGIGPEGEVLAWRDGFTSHTISELESTTVWLFASKTDPRENSRED
jgi:hypothetical protein